jgi:hypothetical protein
LGSVTVRADQTFTVTNDSDSGAGSLRWALSEPCTGVRTVNFTIYNQVIELSAPLVITGPTAIVAVDQGFSGAFREGVRITISGGDAVRPFIVASGASLRLQSLTVANGSAEEGGAIYNDGGDLRVVRCTLLNNSVWDNAAPACATPPGLQHADRRCQQRHSLRHPVHHPGRLPRVL